MRLRFICLLAAMLLAACTTTENYEAQMNRWMGASEHDVVMAFGPPDKAYQLDRHTKLISYTKQDVAAFGGSGFSTCVGSGFGYGRGFGGGCYGPPAQVHVLSCESVFTLTDGKVTRLGHKGNDCRS